MWNKWVYYWQYLALPFDFESPRKSQAATSLSLLNSPKCFSCFHLFKISSDKTMLRLPKCLAGSVWKLSVLCSSSLSLSIPDAMTRHTAVNNFVVWKVERRTAATREPFCFTIGWIYRGGGHNFCFRKLSNLRYIEFTSRTHSLGPCFVLLCFCFFSMQKIHKTFWQHNTSFDSGMNISEDW